MVTKVINISYLEQDLDFSHQESLTRAWEELKVESISHHYGTKTTLKTRRIYKDSYLSVGNFLPLLHLSNPFKAIYRVKCHIIDFDYHCLTIMIWPCRGGIDKKKKDIKMFLHLRHM